MKKKNLELSEESKIVHGTTRNFVTSGDLVPPIHMTSTFKFKDMAHGAGIFDGSCEGFVYSRIANPTTDILEEKVALLEGGEAASAVSSGLAAIAAVCFSLCKPGDNIIACNAIYGGTFALLNKHLADFDIQCRFVSPQEAYDRKKIDSLIDTRTRLMFVETPANPTLDIVDISLWADISKKADIPLVVDNTFATPYLQKPLQLGADIIVHSMTKYLNGHGDIIGGIIVGKKNMIDRIRENYIIHFGPSMSPFNAWLISRGIKTLAIRMEKHCDNAMAIATWLSSHPKVTFVYYPGLKTHTGHSIAKKQMKKYGGMIAFRVKGGIAAGKRIMDSVELCTLAVSLGDCETLIQHPASMTHSTYTKKEREAAGITDGLIRLSVGLESGDDIIADLGNALSLVRA
ncbi:MAG: aminotransferase class I/II-fold pyridoxal phosphate-dependent enzyme [Proteobacteria bacterium]|nr:aminotransferase class I/II-fold pyridoxal phosphate-dependent enzyme [Pseudomonadota bacterium]